MNDSFCSSELLLYVVVSSLRQLAHGPHTSTAKNRAGSPHSVCMYYTTLYTSQLIARHVGKDFSSSEEITGQPREKAPAADVQLAFWEESSTLGRSCCCCYCCCGRRRRSSVQALRADVSFGVNWKGASDSQTIFFIFLYWVTLVNFT